jgi:hypothetical protein
MNYYKKITVFQNRSRSKKLLTFREKVVAYFNTKPQTDFLSDEHETMDSLHLRSEINVILHEAREIIGATGFLPILDWSPPPAVGGYQQRIDLVLNIFLLHRYQMDHYELLDQIERAIGIYSKDYVPSVLRTINPFFWIDTVLRYIANSPFNILRSVGINADKFEISIIGKLGKLTTYLLSLAIMILTILQLTGLLDNFNNYIRKQINKEVSNPQAKPTVNTSDHP